MVDLNKEGALYVSCIPVNRKNKIGFVQVKDGKSATLGFPRGLITVGNKGPEQPTLWVKEKSDLTWFENGHHYNYAALHVLYSQTGLDGKVQRVMEVEQYASRRERLFVCQKPSGTLTNECVMAYFAAEELASADAFPARTLEHLLAYGSFAREHKKLPQLHEVFIQEIVAELKKQSVAT
jgi:hypothetical protein